MAVVTSIMRVQQVLLARVEAVLRPLGLTFARYEVLMLLRFSRKGCLPVGKIGERLQVHPGQRDQRRAATRTRRVRRPYGESGRRSQRVGRDHTERNEPDRGGHRRSSTPRCSRSFRSRPPSSARSTACSRACGGRSEISAELPRCFDFQINCRGAEQPRALGAGLRRVAQSATPTSRPCRESRSNRSTGRPTASFPGQYPYTRGPYASMYRSKLWTMRMFAGFGTADDTNWRFKEIIRSGGDGLVDSVRHADVAGHRLRSSDGARRGRQVRRGRRLAGRHGRPLRRNRPQRDHDVDDDQLPRRGDLRDVRRPGREGGHQPGPPRRHAAERHLEGVPGAEGVRVPTTAVDAAGARHDRLHCCGDATLALDLDLRLPHPRGRLDRGRGAGVHAGQRLRLRRTGDAGRAAGRLVRPAAVVLLQRPHRLLRGDRQVPRRPADLGAMVARALRRQARTVAAAALPHPDGRRVADCPATRGQHRANGDRGVGRRARRHAVAAHQLDGRGDGVCPPRRLPASPCAPSR